MSTQAAWTLALFFGSAIAFGTVRKVTEDQSALVTLVAQLAVGGLIVLAIVLVVRHLDNDKDEGQS